ncbi:hypothetical protein FRB95_004534 [Tulasnella sp. JGI-2019a]|nr:hypothetical protein FRB95_004534 [Tulasnella sp. JGI-2019a]
MALNWTVFNERGRPVPLPRERIISEETRIDIVVKIPDGPPQGEAPSGGSGGAGKTLSCIGTVWLSNLRFIFQGPGSTDSTIQSLSIPYHLITQTKFEQPYFSANYLNMSVYPAPEGGLTPGTTVEVRFPDRGMFAWVEQMMNARNQAIAMRAQEREGEALPVYVPPPVESHGGVGVHPPSGAEAPPDYES